jgi:hypothetical protein
MTEAETHSRRRRVKKPETPEHREKRLRALAVSLADREHRAAAALAARTGQLPRNRGHVTPLEDIEDEEKRLAVQRARVERLEALLAQTERKRETRAKIILGATLLAEARTGRNDPLLATFIDILDRRLDRPRDRLAVHELLGLPISPLKPGNPSPALPDFNSMAQAAAESLQTRKIRPSDIDPDYADLDPPKASRPPRSQRRRAK